MADKKKTQDKLVDLVRNAITKDEALRAEHNIGDKFRFVRDSLHALLARLEEEFAEIDKEIKASVVVMTEDTMDVYVYLFNTQGMDMQSWRKLVSPEVFYEYSVSRPIYTEKEHVEKFIDSRPTRSQHAYITIAISRSMILPPKEDKIQDAIGNPLVRIQEGQLKITQVRGFKHNLIEYNVSPSGELSRKE